MKLSKRLQTIADLIEDDSSVIDVGADHALLDIYLNLYKNCNCLAIDKSEGACFSAINNILKYKANVEVINNDGLNNIKLNDEIIVISGMGTKNIIKILDFDITNDLILSSHTNIADLKQFLDDKNYYIYKEVIVNEYKTYTILYAKERRDKNE